MIEEQEQFPNSPQPQDLYVYINRVSGTVSATPFTLRQLCMILNPPISVEDGESSEILRSKSAVEFDLLCGDENENSDKRQAVNDDVYNQSTSSLCSTDDSSSVISSFINEDSRQFSEDMRCCVGSMINPDTVVARVNPLMQNPLIQSDHYQWSKIKETPVLREASFQWYYEVESGWGEVAGPFSCRQLARKVYQRSVNKTTRVWSAEGETLGWKSIEEHPHLCTVLSLFQPELLRMNSKDAMVDTSVVIDLLCT